MPNLPVVAPRFPASSPIHWCALGTARTRQRSPPALYSSRFDPNANVGVGDAYSLKHLDRAASPAFGTSPDASQATLRLVKGAFGNANCPKVMKRSTMLRISYCILSNAT